MAEQEGEWKHVLTIGGETTPEQRHRNWELYQRLERDLHEFCFSGPDIPFAFTLGPESECHRRLLSFICDHFPTEDIADERVKELETENARLRKGLQWAYDNALPCPFCVGGETCTFHETLGGVLDGDDQ